jgi:hypothetical protein
MVRNQAPEYLAGLHIEKEAGCRRAPTSRRGATAQFRCWPLARVLEYPSSAVLLVRAKLVGPRVRAKGLTGSCGPCTNPTARNAFRHRLRQLRTANPGSQNPHSTQLAKLVVRPPAQPGLTHEIEFDGSP